MKKAGEGTATLFGLAVLGGAFVALGGLFASVTIAAAAPIPVGQFAVNLLAVTAGNWVGGARLVGSVYWLIFRRNRSAVPAQRR